MREIKFRGKRKDGKEWLTGDLNHIDGKVFIFPRTEDTRLNSPDWFEVHPDTVGQYIEVKGYTGEYQDRHKNEVGLFEGDIVEAMSEGSRGTFVIKFRNDSAPKWLLYPNYQSDKHWDIHASDLGRTKGDYYDDLRRIGNIFDNPELTQK